MNLPNILIGLIVIALFALAIRYLCKNGTCAGCSEKDSHHSDCSDCHSCPYSNHCQAEPEKAKR